MTTRIHACRSLVLALLVALPASGMLAAGQAPAPAPMSAAPATIRPALDGLFEAFASHPLVGLGEMHGVAELLAFHRQIIRDPRFAAEVGNVVVEFGGAAHQGIIDRYVNGEPVGYAELRKVWTETVGWQPTVFSEGYALFFAQVRQTNLALPRDRRIRVWLGEPPIDWSRISTAEEYKPILATRDTYPADLIVRHILAPGKKALVIYGSAHFDITQAWENAALAEIAAADPGGPMSKGSDATLRDLVEKQYPGSFFVAQPYRGFRNEECTRRFEEGMKDWPMPALAVSVPGTLLAEEIWRCLTPRTVRFPPTIPADVQQRVRALVAANDRDRPLLSDAILFYAPASQLTQASPFLEFALDEEWRAELSRRNQIIAGRALPADWGRTLPAGPTPYLQRD